MRGQGLLSTPQNDRRVGHIPNATSIVPQIQLTSSRTMHALAYSQLHGCSTASARATMTFAVVCLSRREAFSHLDADVLRVRLARAFDNAFADSCPSQIIVQRGCGNAFASQFSGQGLRVRVIIARATQLYATQSYSSKGNKSLNRTGSWHLGGALVCDTALIRVFFYRVTVVVVGRRCQHNLRAIRSELVEAHVKWMQVCETEARTKLANLYRSERVQKSVTRQWLHQWRAVVASRLRSRKRLCVAQRRQYLCLQALKRWQRALVIKVAFALCTQIIAWL